jgi:sigma-70-like protein
MSFEELEARRAQSQNAPASAPPLSGPERMRRALTRPGFRLPQTLKAPAAAVKRELLPPERRAEIYRAAAAKRAVRFRQGVVAELRGMRQWFGALSEQSRAVVEGLLAKKSDDRIARDLGIDVDEVKVALRESRATLRAHAESQAASESTGGAIFPVRFSVGADIEGPRTTTVHAPFPVDLEESMDPPAVRHVREKMAANGTGAQAGRIRSKTIAPKNLTRDEVRCSQLTVYPTVERPRTRGECENMPRPCPFVSCSHHLYLDVNTQTGAIKLNFPHLEVWEMRETCSLDVADRGGITLEEVGAIMNLTRERIRQVEVRGLRMVKEAAADELGITPERATA